MSPEESQKIIDNLRLIVQQWNIRKKSEATGDLIDNKITDKITKTFQQNNSETIANEHD